jgi:undecaprenyl diphosphate synthase
MNDGIAADEVTEEMLANKLYTAGMPDPDLVLRTSGEKRISNFLLWQMAYSEIFFIDTLWPDFDEAAYLELIEAYQKRNRTYGSA